MAWFVVQSERKTWTKYLVEAADEDAALARSDHWQYIGYLDGDDTESSVAGDAFPTKVAALADTVSYVDG